ncbi:Ribose and galactose chemoreceptor protein [Cedecea neteri]|uniref:Ribose and galactose chemoreceptor protein n=1 Tax=Cedecea neteri TaxID=158822 RepID=A0A2X3JF84_9ENTR|nr:Ribose and galactose chemoreceptor protein [Cedecea neteri]
MRFWHHIRLVPLFSSILGGILLLFALCIGFASYFLIQSDRALQDVTEEIQVRMGLADSANHLRTARINLINAGAASRVADMDQVKQNVANAEGLIKQAQDGFNAYMARKVKTPEDQALDKGLQDEFATYLEKGMKPMLKFAKNGMFEAIITHESEVVRKLDSDYGANLQKAVSIRTERANALREQADNRTRTSVALMAGAFALALFMTVFNLHHAAPRGDWPAAARGEAHRAHLRGGFNPVGGSDRQQRNWQAQPAPAAYAAATGQHREHRA